ncbi:glycosyltransferase [Oscillatoria salina]|uniref:glycosyltransferase n=1 Tax=Oscillatoria salina TaxID=331517 RepID=UPI001CCFC2B1|nr:glycosyltransferase [Oscillatoria salina]MBZ8182199.1 glycosyltransferase [Oscillatoria salina IIICB1]
MPIISVIVPAFNAEKTIQETINSVINQTFSNFELIIINDGSQDSTLEILESIKDPRIKIFSYPNAGAAVSRNRGFAKAVGEYIAFLDADDLWTPDKLEAQLSALQATPEAAVAYSWSDCIDETSKFLRPGGHISINGNAYAKLLMVDILENGSNPLIHRQAFIEVGGFDESLQAGQDWDLYLRLAAKYHFVTVPRSQILYRISANSMSADVWRLETASLQLISRAYSKAPSSLQKLKKYSLGNIYKYLTVKAIEGNPERKKGIAAIRFLGQTVKNDPLLLKHRIIWKVFLRALAIAVLPDRQAKVLLKNIQQLSGTSALLAYMKINT